MWSQCGPEWVSRQPSCLAACFLLCAVLGQVSLHFERKCALCVNRHCLVPCPEALIVHPDLGKTMSLPCIQSTFPGDFCGLVVHVLLWLPNCEKRFGCILGRERISLCGCCQDPGSVLMTTVDHMPASCHSVSDSSGRKGCPS